jgi:hypothetical protein
VIRIDQTLFEEGRGNCLPACLATLLELPLSQVPNFCYGDPPEEAWYPRFAAWLFARGRAPYSLSFEDTEALDRHLEWARLYGSKTPWLAGGMTPLGRHFCVYLGAHLFHDPNPYAGRTGLAVIQDATFLLRSVV